MYLYNNKLTGPIPTSLPLSLQHLYLCNNKLVGPIPTLPSSLGHLDLSDNELTGPIPTNLPTTLTKLKLSNNKLKIPTGIPKMGRCSCESIHST
eukprot:UN01734